MIHHLISAAFLFVAAGTWLLRSFQEYGKTDWLFSVFTTCLLLLLGFVNYWFALDEARTVYSKCGDSTKQNEKTHD